MGLAYGKVLDGLKFHITLINVGNSPSRQPAKGATVVDMIWVPPEAARLCRHIGLVHLFLTMPLFLQILKFLQKTLFCGLGQDPREFLGLRLASSSGMKTLNIALSPTM